MFNVLCTVVNVPPQEFQDYVGFGEDVVNIGVNFKISGEEDTEVFV